MPPRKTGYHLITTAQKRAITWLIDAVLDPFIDSPLYEEYRTYGVDLNEAESKEEWDKKYDRAVAVLDELRR